MGDSSEPRPEMQTESAVVTLAVVGDIDDGLVCYPVDATPWRHRVPHSFASRSV